MQETGTEAFLQVAQPLAQARCGNLLFGGSAAEISMPRDGDEGLEVAKVRLAHCAQRRTVCPILCTLSRVWFGVIFCRRGITPIRRTGS
jgi:hypothetical protein